MAPCYPRLFLDYPPYAKGYPPGLSPKITMGYLTCLEGEEAKGVSPWGRGDNPRIAWKGIPVG